jgi:hypothetical protein
VLFCLGGSRRGGVEWNDAAGALLAEYPGRTRSFTWRRWTWADSIRAGSPRGRLRWVHRLINGGLDGNNACWLGYTADGAVVLGTDRIDDWLVLGPNPWDSVSNSQCTVWRGTPGDGTRATMAGRTVYLSLKVPGSTPTGEAGRRSTGRCGRREIFRFPVGRRWVRGCRRRAGAT